MGLAHLQRVPCDQLQANQRVEEFGQTQADVGVPVAFGKVSPPHLKMGLDEVERVEVFHHILKHLLALFDDAICSGGEGHKGRETRVRRESGPVRSLWIGVCLPLSVLKLVTSVDVSSSSEDRPSLCSARLPFCSRACRLRALRQTMTAVNKHCNKNQTGQDCLDPSEEKGCDETLWIQALNS